MKAKRDLVFTAMNLIWEASELIFTVPYKEWWTHVTAVLRFLANTVPQKKTPDARNGLRNFNTYESLAALVQRKLEPVADPGGQFGQLSP